MPFMVQFLYMIEWNINRKDKLMFLQLRKISDEIDIPRVYVTTNTSEFVNIYAYKTKITVKIWNDETGVNTEETFKKDKKNKFFDVLKWIETKVSMEVKL